MPQTKRTTHLGITMEWTIYRRTHHFNAANPYVINGWVDGIQRMQHGLSKLERAEKAVISRIEAIAKERATVGAADSQP